MKKHLSFLAIAAAFTLLMACGKSTPPGGAKIGTDGATTTTPAAGGSSVYTPAPATPATPATPEAKAQAAGEAAQAKVSADQKDAAYRDAYNATLAAEQ